MFHPSDQELHWLRNRSWRRSFIKFKRGVSVNSSTGSWSRHTHRANELGWNFTITTLGARITTLWQANSSSRAINSFWRRWVWGVVRVASLIIRACRDKPATNYYRPYLAGHNKWHAGDNSWGLCGILSPIINYNMGTTWTGGAFCIMN